MEEKRRPLKPIYIYKHLVKLEYVLKQDLNITLSEISVLTSLADQGEQKMGELVRWVELPMSTVTGLVDKLVTKKLVIRQKKTDDKRVMMLKMTEEGAAVISGCGRILSQQLLSQELMSQLAFPSSIQAKQVVVNNNEPEENTRDRKNISTTLNLEWD